MAVSLCAGCGRAIHDKFMYSVIGKIWHATCVKCYACGSSLTERCFSRDSRLFCKEDFFERYGVKCSGCDKVILADDLVRKASDKVFHVCCLTCVQCKKQLMTGEEVYIVNGDQMLCREDYMTLSNAQQPSASNGCNDIASTTHSLETRSPTTNPVDFPTHTVPFSPSNTSNAVNISSNFSNQTETSNARQSRSVHNTSENNDGRASVFNSLDSHVFSSFDSVMQHDQQSRSRKTNNLETSSIEDEDSDGSGKHEKSKRGPRTTIKSRQLQVLSDAFNTCQKPTKQMREDLSAQTGLSVRVIQVWFQNRRSKERRLRTHETSQNLSENDSINQASLDASHQEFVSSPADLFSMQPQQQPWS